MTTARSPLSGGGRTLMLLALVAAGVLTISYAHAEQPDTPPMERKEPAPTPVPASAPAASQPSAEPQPSQEELRRRVDILTEEVQQLKEQLVLPEKEEYRSQYGMGPAASKVYRVNQGISFGGYGEFHVQQKVKDKGESDFSTGDFVRYVQYIGYKFNDYFLANMEVELEHSFTGTNFEGKGGSVSLEFGYLDFLPHPAINVRFGLVLVPVGFINEIHEPPFFHGNLRPAVEQIIIPTTWRELGGGIFGAPVQGLSYKLFAVNGFNAEKFSDKGWRDGRQKGGRVLAESWAVVGRVDYDWRHVAMVGGSAYYGGADQNRIPDVSANTLLLEAHAQLRFRGLELRALGAFGHLSGADGLTLALFPDPSDPADGPETRAVAEMVYGWYVEVAYDFWPLLSRLPLYLAPYFRYEQLNTQAKVPDVPGRQGNPARDIRLFEGGLTFKPHPQIVVKLNYRDEQSVAPTPVSDAFFVGAGFVY